MSSMPLDIVSTDKIQCDQCGEPIGTFKFNSPAGPNWKEALCPKCEEMEFTLHHGDENWPHPRAISLGETGKGILEKHFAKTLLPDVSRNPPPEYEVVIESTGHVLGADERLRDAPGGFGEKLVAREKVVVAEPAE